MEIYNDLTVTMSSIPQAAAFADAFRRVFRYDLPDTQIPPELEAFAQNGGCMQLQEIPFEAAATFAEEYKQIFLKAAKTVSDAPFTACAVSSGDENAVHRFSYENGHLKRRYLWTQQCPLLESCQVCGAEFPAPLSLEAWLNTGAKTVCTSCGSPAFPEGTYRLAEEDICLDEFFSCSDADLHRALSLCRNHRPELGKDARCGCFFCKRIFSPAEIEDWETSEAEIRGTAICPHCDAGMFGFYTVIGESSGCPIDADFLRQLYNYWYWEEDL